MSAHLGAEPEHLVAASGVRGHGLAIAVAVDLGEVGAQSERSGLEAGGQDAAQLGELCL